MGLRNKNNQIRLGLCRNPYETKGLEHMPEFRKYFLLQKNLESWDRGPWKIYWYPRDLGMLEK